MNDHESIVDGWGKRYVFKNPRRVAFPGLPHRRASEEKPPARPKTPRVPKPKSKKRSLYVAECPVCMKRYGIFEKPLVEPVVTGSEVIYVIRHFTCVNKTNYIGGAI